MSAFDRLAPFIQDFIYREGWEQLRDVQVAACNVLLDTDDNLLLSSGTASGKTEAAFLPILTKLHQEPAQSVGVLYISPLKALINDQFKRLEQLLDESGIPVTKWHGDANRTEKNRLLKHPRGVVQTTPESLEAMLMRRKTDCIRLFADLKYVVIDEVHYFMTGDRGTQLICLLERMQRLIGRVPVRVGLSATLGDYEEAEHWLCAGTGRRCRTPLFHGQKRSLRLAMNYFAVGSDDEKMLAISGIDADMQGEVMASAVSPKNGLQLYYRYLYAATFNKRCILFSNSKAEVEMNISTLKQMAGKQQSNQVYLVHHGNISAGLREFAEDQMKNAGEPVVVGATVTLELGIDLGDLERIVQTGTPFSVSSFVQRLGRTGRRGAPSEMWFAFREDVSFTDDVFYKSINWPFLMCIAIIQLYLEEKWIEPIPHNCLPYGILFHQTMSFLAAQGEVSPAFLAEQMLTLSLFKEVSQADYRLMLQFLISNNLIEKTERNGLIIGQDAENMINHFDFFSVFESNTEFSVRQKAEEIGTVQQAFPTGERFSLAGKSWEVIDVDMKGRILHVKEISGITSNKWNSYNQSMIHSKILRKMRDVLCQDSIFSYLGESAAERLQVMRLTARKANITSELVVRIDECTTAVFPFLGTKEMTTLSVVLTSLGVDNQIYWDRNIPVCIFVKGRSVGAVQVLLETLRAKTLDTSVLVVPEKLDLPGKFNRYVPAELLKKQFLVDFIDVDGLRVLL